MKYKIAPIFKKLHSYIIMSLLLLGAVIFYHVYIYYFRCGDMGLKIGAARLQAQGKDAYFYTEANGERVVNGVTSTPLLNMLHTPFINANSCQVKQASFWGNFAFVAGCFFFIAWLASKSHWARIYILASIILLVILFAAPFYYNLDHGQVYVMYTMLFFVLLFLLQKKQYFILGIVWAFAIAIRPLFLTGSILALLYFNRKIIAGLLTGALLVILITLITGTAHYWQEYSLAMKQYAYEVPCLRNAGCTEWKRHLIATMDDTYANCKQTLNPLQTNRINSVLQAGTFFQGLQSWLVAAHKTITNVNFYSVVLCIVTCLFVSGIRFRLKELPIEKYVLLIFLLYIFSEICVPAVRLRYSPFVWLFAIAIMITKANVVEIVMLLPGLCLLFGYHHNYKFGEFWLIMPCLIYMLRKSEKPYYLKWFALLKTKLLRVKGS